MTLQEILYDTLTGSTAVMTATQGRIYHKYLPVDFNIDEITAVFIANASGSEGSFDDSDEIETMDADIKLNYYRSAELYALLDFVKNAVLKIDDEKVKYVEYRGNELVWNPDFEFYNLVIRFQLQYEK